MPLDTVTLPSIWDIPVAAGVPALLGQSIGSGISASASTALGGVLENWTTNQAAKKWGIFNSSSENVLSSARVMGVEYESGYAISDAPQEDGAFVSYNKVKQPYAARVLFVCDGSETGDSLIMSQLNALIASTGLAEGSGTTVDLAVRQGFVATLERIVADTSLYSVVTPEKTYLNANIVGYRWRRSSENGISMLIAEVALQEVRLGASALYYNTREPQGQETVQNGTVQATTPSIPVQTALLGVTL